MEEVDLGGKIYISSKRAAKNCGYAQDYIGQLARKGLIDAQRIGGLWYVFMESVEAHKKQAETYKPEPQKYRSDASAQTSIVVESREFVSAPFAAELTGYNSDYVGQLARNAKVPSRQIGNRWYVDKEALFKHKEEKDALLAAVQTESVGLKKPEIIQVAPKIVSQPEILSYSTESPELMPVIKEIPKTEDLITPRIYITPSEPEERSIPIRIIETTPLQSKNAVIPVKFTESSSFSISEISIYKANILAYFGFGAAAIIVVLLLIKLPSLLPVLSDSVGSVALPASLQGTSEAITTALEPHLTKELIYKRK